MAFDRPSLPACEPENACKRVGGLSPGHGRVGGDLACFVLLLVIEAEACDPCDRLGRDPARRGESNTHELSTDVLGCNSKPRGPYEPCIELRECHEPSRIADNRRATSDRGNRLGELRPCERLVRTKVFDGRTHDARFDHLLDLDGRPVARRIRTRRGVSHTNDKKSSQGGESCHYT